MLAGVQSSVCLGTVLGRAGGWEKASGVKEQGILGVNSGAPCLMSTSKKPAVVGNNILIL